MDFVRPHRNIYKQCAPTLFMAYTEIKQRNGKKYFYRVRTLRQGNKFKKLRIYLGKEISKVELQKKEKQADEELSIKIKREKINKLNEIILKIRKILEKYKIKKAGIFGSYAEGEQKRYSDIDILVQPTKDMGFNFAGLEIELSEKLNKKVDLVSYNGLSPFLKERILKQEVKII